MLDPNTYRKDLVDYGSKIFFNSAGASLAPQSVNEKIFNYLHEEAIHGGYALADMRQNELELFYSRAAALIGALPANIAFANSATEAYAKALTSIPFKENDVIITTDDDYVSNYINFLSLKKRFSIRIARIRNLENGDLDINHFMELVRKHTPKLVAVTHVPTNSGLVQDIEAIGAICRENNIIYLVDACQSAGQLQLDISSIQCDFLSATGRKFLRGPRGTGFLFVSDRILDAGYYPLMIDGRGAIWDKEDNFSVIPTARRFETWEVPYALVMGFSEALQYANAIGVPEIMEYNSHLMHHFREQLSAISDARILDLGSKKCNILTLRKEGISLGKTRRMLQNEEVYFSISTRQWGYIDFGKKGVEWAIRLSPHYFNTIDETDRVVDIIDSIR